MNPHSCGGSRDKDIRGGAWHREVKTPAHDHTARNWQNQYLNLNLLSPSMGLSHNAQVLQTHHTPHSMCVSFPSGGGRRRPSRKCFFGIGLFWETAHTGKALEKQSRCDPSVREIYIYKEGLGLVRMCPSLYQDKKAGSKSQENLISGEAQN